MAKKLLLFPLLLFNLFSRAQCPTLPCVSCVDTPYINIYYYCYDDYFPVCGCDGVTYRSVCAAYNWGGLLHAPNPFPNGDGPCGSFDFEFTPNPIVPGTPLNDFGKLSIYNKKGPSTVLIQIYDIFGRIWYTKQITINAAPPVYTTDIRMDSFPQGLYYLFVSMNGEDRKKKIMKANRI